MTGHELTIAITSAGRRLYLVEWFRAALRHSGVRGSVVVADGDPQAPALQAGDERVVLPPFRDAGYPEAVLEMCRSRSVGLLVTLNDYEAARLAGGTAAELEAGGTLVPVLGADAAEVAADKWLTAVRLGQSGVRVPDTWLGDEVLAGAAEGLDVAVDVVVKHRFGSASSGLAFGRAADAAELVRASARDAPDRTGSVDGREARPDLVVLQRRIRGEEFGVDVVADLQGHFATALARKKLRMRAGETDRAVTVPGEQFLTMASAVCGATGSRGLMDTDVVVDDQGVAHLIDLNPRFGGGYPFSHVAGANVPACYVAWATGLPVEDAWLSPSPGTAGAKFESITAVRDG